MLSGQNKRLSLAVILLSAVITTAGQGFRTLSTSDGLSNNAIFSMYQDDLGHLWIGTADGLNIWNGHSLETYDPKDGKNFFSGNSVRNMYPSHDGGIWIRTYYGLAYIDIKTGEIRYYDSLSFTKTMTCSRTGIAYVIASDNSLHYFNRITGKFTKSDVKFLETEGEDCKRLHCHGQDSLYCFTDSGIYLLGIETDMQTGEIRLTHEGKTEMGAHYVSEISDGHICYLASKKGKDIYTFDMKTRETLLYSEVGSKLPPQEVIRALLPCKNGLHIGTSVSGVYLAPPNNDILLHTQVKTGVFSMINDRMQDLIWVGTDCYGVIKWQSDDINMESVTFDQLPIHIRMPVRSIFLDKNRKLWCGTKGDGIFTIEDFSPDMHIKEHNVRKYTSTNSTLANNNVYALTGSKDSTGIWIGSNGPGLNFYSYKENRIKTVPGSQTLRNVHAILEHGKNTLYIGTDSKGTYRCTVSELRTGNPVIIKTEKIEFPAPFGKSDRIYSISVQNDSVIWFGSRGKGAACLNTRTSTSSVQTFSSDKGYSSNDIYSITATDRMNFASGCGLVTYDSRTEEHAIAEAIPYRATHGILSDWDGNLWISTNYGLVSYNEDSRQSKIYGAHSDLKILEYSDGACHKDNRSKTLFFGGTNGFTVIRCSEKGNKDSILYTPPINITQIIYNNQSAPLDDNLILPYNRNSFSIRFSVVDNINYQDYKFSYRILGFEDTWKDNGNADIINLPTLPPGRYTLEIRYHNKSNSYTSHPAELPIKIVPPLYARWWAITLYILIIMAVAIYYIRLFRIKYLKLKQEVQMSQSLNNVDHIFLTNMLRIINENMDNPELSVSYIADKLCISTRVLYRKLEKAPHLKPQKLIKEARMKAAAQMLESTQMTVEEIMYKVGFDNRSTFYKNFKESYGITPKEYREQTVK